MFIPKIYHELALKRLTRYLKNTQDHGLVLDTNYDIFKVDAYPDSEFAGMYGHEKHDNLECANSCTGFIIMFSNFPVLCVPKLKTETSLSKMEA